GPGCGRCPPPGAPRRAAATGPSSTREAAVSLLDRGTETVLVWPQTTTTDPDGNPIHGIADAPVTVRCRVQPVSSRAVIAAGERTQARYRLSARDAPLGPWARVYWRGRDWGVAGEPKYQSGVRANRDVVAGLRARG